MPCLNVVKADGETTTLEVPVGRTLMDATVREMIPGIFGECGGGLACGTCHIIVDAAWATQLLPASDEMERDMLEAIEGAGPCSRLACQIGMSEALDGLIVRVPQP